MLSLLDLPNHIHDRIWELVILDSLETVPSLLLVSRQVYEESQPFMYRRPLTFESQEYLYTWLEQSETSNLHNVDALSVCLKLDDTAALANSNDIHGYRSVAAENELSRMQRALELMPNITTLAIYKHLADERPEYRQLYDEILRSLGRLFPQLKSLAIHTDSHSLNFLRHLPAIQRLQFTGFAASSPMETEAILSHLRHLQDIEIIPSLRSIDCSPPSPRRTLLQPCLSREVLRSLRCKGLSINESQTLSPSAPSFWTPTFLHAMPSLRRHCLTKFGVVLDDFAPDAKCVGLFCSFLRQSHVQDLTVEWDGAADILNDVLDALPRSLVSIRLGRFVGMVAVLTLLDEISQRKTNGLVPGLKELVVVQDDSSSDSVSQHGRQKVNRLTRHQSELVFNIEDAIRILDQIGIKVHFL
jgi:hypothetical protein